MVIYETGFVKSANTIQLTPAEGNYTFGLYVRVTDPAGNTRELFAPGQPVHIKGDSVVLEGAYQDYAAMCALKYSEILHKFRPKARPDADPMGPGELPVAGGATRLHPVDCHVRRPARRRGTRASQKAHGSSFERTLFSPEARTIDLSEAT